jgi:uncharacterized membrane protein YhfC
MAVMVVPPVMFTVHVIGLAVSITLPSALKATAEVYKQKKQRN